MLDRSLPHIGVIMVRPAQPLPSRPPLPAGYAIVHYRPGMEKAWAAIETAAGEFDDPAAALNRFQTEFLPHAAELADRCLFIVDPQGSPVATTTAWYGSQLGRERQPRLHWVAVMPDHQGRGLARALIGAALQVYRQLGEDGDVYLTTQTWSTVAIRLYLDYGFLPYRGPQPAGWASESGDYAADQQRAWALIMDRIKSFDSRQVNRR